MSDNWSSELRPQDEKWIKTWEVPFRRYLIKSGEPKLLEECVTAGCNRRDLIAALYYVAMCTESSLAESRRIQDFLDTLDATIQALDKCRAKMIRLISDRGPSFQTIAILFSLNQLPPKEVNLVLSSPAFLEQLLKHLKQLASQRKRSVRHAPQIQQAEALVFTYIQSATDPKVAQLRISCLIEAAGHAYGTTRRSYEDSSIVKRYARYKKECPEDFEFVRQVVQDFRRRTRQETPMDLVQFFLNEMNQNLINVYRHKTALSSQ
jgi:hypothetical protein